MLRIKKIAKEIKRVISKRIFLGLQVPISGLITISEIDLSSDFKYAKIYFSIFNIEKDASGVKKILISQIPFFKKELAAKLHLRIIPNLIFIYDDSVKKAAQINKLLHRL